MVRANVEARVEDILKDFSGLNSAKELFSELNYEVARDTLGRRGWSRQAQAALAEDPQIIATHGDFHIIYGRLNSDKPLITPERAVTATLLREHPYGLFLFSDCDQTAWHFVNVKLARDKEDGAINKDVTKRRLFRRISVETGQTRVRTATERLNMLDLAELARQLAGGIPPLTIQSQHDKAFDVEQVTKEFYTQYETVFKGLWGNLEGQTGERRWAHDYALQFLNRLMFLYFIQRKGWLAGDKEFICTLWQSYRSAKARKNTFFEDWLKVLFFEAFNDHKNLLNTRERAHLPKMIRDALWAAPYLNGGLFRENRLDTPVFDFQIADRSFEEVFNVLEKYNFTITEDSPLDKEVAVDPEMIGKVYESLVNLSEAGMERSAAGIFYTPRTEIDLMCRLALVDNLTNHLGEKHKNLFYELVFSLDQEEKEQADKAVGKAQLWPSVEQHLNQITVVDPACGSGSFLVGMLHVLNNLLERAEQQRGRAGNSYERKKRIIGQSLYGVDTMDWACHVAELRLWLALTVDAEFTKEQLRIRREPLLPNFTFKVRCGDSLVQELGGMNLAHRRDETEITPAMKRRLSELKSQKAKFYHSDPTCRFKSPQGIEQEEVRVFRELLQDRISTLDREARDLMRQQAELKVHRQMRLTGELEGSGRQLSLKHEELEQAVKSRMEEKTELETRRDAVRDRASVPFIWDIAFAEIFAGRHSGFDIIIGNPPYVRQEKIAGPSISQEETTNEGRKAYKEKLARSVYQVYPVFFGYDCRLGKPAHTVAAKSDLYIYFYFRGLSLLNAGGSFCFITSNSWLDVAYGAELQEFLLRRCHIRCIIDNKAKRSFKEADVNTVITLLSTPESPKVTDGVSLAKVARFVVFNVPFEEVLHPLFFEEIHDTRCKATRQEYRVIPASQDSLFLYGCESVQKEPKLDGKKALVSVPQYIGNKWGSRYLRGPDIYWTLLDN